MFKCKIRTGIVASKFRYSGVVKLFSFSNLKQLLPVFGGQELAFVV